MYEEEEWDVVEEIPGPLRAELLRGLLEAQGIPADLNQEGAGRYGYPVTIGRLGLVQILVPRSFVRRAQQVLADYYAGKFEVDDPGEEDGIEEE